MLSNETNVSPQQGDLVWLEQWSGHDDRDFAIGRAHDDGIYEVILRERLHADSNWEVAAEGAGPSIANAVAMARGDWDRAIREGPWPTAPGVARVSGEPNVSPQPLWIICLPYDGVCVRVGYFTSEATAKTWAETHSTTNDVFYPQPLLPRVPCGDDCSDCYHAERKRQREARDALEVTNAE